MLLRIDGVENHTYEDVMEALSLLDGLKVEVVDESPRETPSSWLRLPKKDSQRQAFLLAYAQAGSAGLTREQAKDALGLTDHSDCFTRVSELVEGGYLAPTGEQRRTRAGELAAVVAITDKAKGEMWRATRHWFPDGKRIVVGS